MAVQMKLIQESRTAGVEGGLRTETVSGITEMLPKPGRSFVMFAESLTPEGSVRLITTSRVKLVIKVSPLVRIFETQNTVYKLYLDEPPTLQMLLDEEAP